MISDLGIDSPTNTQSSTFSQKVPKTSSTSTLWQSGSGASGFSQMNNNFLLSPFEIMENSSNSTPLFVPQSSRSYSHVTSNGLGFNDNLSSAKPIKELGSNNLFGINSDANYVYGKQFNYDYDEPSRFKSQNQNFQPNSHQNQNLNQQPNHTISNSISNSNSTSNSNSNSNNSIANNQKPEFQTNYLHNSINETIKLRSEVNKLEKQVQNLQIELKLKSQVVCSLQEKVDNFKKHYESIDKSIKGNITNTPVNQKDTDSADLDANSSSKFVQVFEDLSQKYQEQSEKYEETKLRLESLVTAMALNPQRANTFNGEYDEEEIAHKIVTKLNVLTQENQNLLKMMSCNNRSTLLFEIELLKEANEKLNMQLKDSKC